MILRRHQIASILGAAAMMGAVAASPSQAAPPTPTVQQLYSGPQLDKAQTAKAGARRMKMQADLKELNANKTLTPAQKQAKFLKLKAGYEDDMLQILTPGQRKQFLANRAQIQAQMQQQQAAFQTRMAEMQKLGKQINDSMSPDQKKQLQSIKAATGAQAKKIYDDKSIAPTARKSRMDALEKDYESKVTAIMTPAQQKQFQRLQEIQAEQIKMVSGGR